MGKNYVRGHTYFLSKERADSMRPILRWIKKDAPRTRERSQATRILREIEGIKEHKQILLSRGEAEMLAFIIKEFPEGVGVERQLELQFSFGTAPVTRLSEAPQSYGHTPSGEPVELPEPSVRALPKPELKSELTSEEEAERAEALKRARYEPKPDSYYEKRLKEGS